MTGRGGIKPGLAKRLEEVARLRTTRSQKALRRQLNVDIDEPAVEGGDRPSEIRSRAEKKARSK